MQSTAPRATEPRHIGAVLVAGLVLIATFGAVSWWSVHVAVDGQRGDSAVIDQAGKQRMRSQRLALAAESMTHGGTDAEAARSELIALADAFRRAHADLAPPRDGATTDPLFDVYHRPDGVSDQVDEYLGLVDEVIGATGDDGVLDRADVEPLLARALDPAPDALLGVLDEAVAAHGADAERRVDGTDVLAGGLAVGQLIVLAVVGVAVFRPLARRLRRTLQELRAARDDLATVLDHAAIGILTVDGGGRIEAANTYARELVRPADGSLLGLDLPELAAPSSVEHLRSAIAAAASGRTVVVNADLRAGDGRIVTAEVTVAGGVGDGRALTVLVGDISERLEMLRELERLAHHDPLTGLPNRRSFRRSLTALIERGSRGAVLFVDLNGFKAVNDELGHAAGDEVLAEVGRRLLLALRGSDIVARLGGDEFAGLLYRCDLEHAQLAADRIVESVAQPIETSAGAVGVTASVGISLADGAAMNADVVLRSADTAMYRAKAAHRASIRAGLAPCRPVDVELVPSGS